MIYQKLNIDSYEVNSDSYLSLPAKTDILAWHRDAAFALNTEAVKRKVGIHTIKFFIYLNPTPFLFNFKRKGSLTLKDSKLSSEGALALIPCSSRFSKAVNNAIFHDFISLDRDHSLEDLVSRVQEILGEMDR